MDGQGTKCRSNIAENLNRLSRAHERYRRQTTDGRAIAYSEREREFTFANNNTVHLQRCVDVAGTGVLASQSFEVSWTTEKHQLSRRQPLGRQAV